MRMPHRLFWGSIAVCAWLFVVAPALSEFIHRSTLEGPEPFSVSTVRTILYQNDDTGAPNVDPETTELLSQLAALELSENERVTALWSLVDEETRSVALQQIDAVPPLTYAVDPRFFDPLTPSIIQRTIESYGYSLAPLPKSALKQRRETGDQREQLMTILSLIHHDLLSQEQAAMILQGAVDLLDLQMKRKGLEEALRAELQGQL